MEANPPGGPTPSAPVPQPERKLVQDIGPRPYASPAPAPQAPAATPSVPVPQQQIKTSIVDDIPVRQPAGAAAPAAPTAAQADDELDKILHDVNKEVKSSSAPTPRKNLLSAFNIFKKKSAVATRPAPTAPNAQQNTQAPVIPVAQPPARRFSPLVVIAVVAITGLLVAAAVYAFRGGSNKPVANSGPTHQVTTPLSTRNNVTTTSLDQFNQTLQGDLTSLKDQDFDSASLSDQALGL